MNRRDTVFGLLLLGAAPLASLAQQQGKVWRVGFLSQRGRPDAREPPTFFDGFTQGMRELGYAEGRNLVIEWRFAENKVERLPVLVEELVRLKVDVILAAATPAVAAAQKNTAAIPIVFVNAGDPIGSGFIKSLAHPGGNITGLTNMYADIMPKYLEMLLGMVPKLERVAFLLNPGNLSQSNLLISAQVAAEKVKLKILPFEANTAGEVEIAFGAMAREKVGAVIVSADALYVQQQRQIAELAAKYRLPSIAGRKGQVEAGILMSYGPNDAELFRGAAIYVDKIFKGAKPGDLPVAQPTKFELYINGKTAKALGLTIPQSMLVRVDEVIR